MSIRSKHRIALRIYSVGVNFKTNLNNEYALFEFHTVKNLGRFYVKVRLETRCLLKYRSQTVMAMLSFLSQTKSYITVVRKHCCRTCGVLMLITFWGKHFVVSPKKIPSPFTWLHSILVNC